MIRILVADDHAVVRRGIKEMLADASDHFHVEEVGTAPEVLDRVGAEDWDLLILDLNMPGRGGLDLLGDIRRDRPRLPVLVLSMYPEDQFAMRALRAGASGYVTKESAPEELITAVNKIVKGGRYVSGALAERMAISLGPESDRPPHEALSDREFQVLRLIASGKTVSQIADELSLSVKTISTYRTRILEKMAMTTNAELTVYAVRAGLVG
jgi:DNA-binding NarL/FixJ family response regulator